MKAILTAVEARADHFTLLQVPRNAEPPQLRDAYFRLAKIVHPDLPAFAGNPALKAEATRAFQAITAANQTLADPNRRKQYMQQLMQAAIDRAEIAAEGLQARAVQTATSSQAALSSQPPTAQRTAVQGVQAPAGTAPQSGTPQQTARTTAPQETFPAPGRATVQTTAVGLSAPGAVNTSFGGGRPATGAPTPPGSGPITPSRVDTILPPGSALSASNRALGYGYGTGQMSSVPRSGTRPAVIVEDITAGSRVGSLGATGQFARLTGTNPVVSTGGPSSTSATAPFARQPTPHGLATQPNPALHANPTTQPNLSTQTRPTPSAGSHMLGSGTLTPGGAAFMTATGQFQRPTPGPQTPPVVQPTPDSGLMMDRAPSSTRGLEAPPNAEVARIYLHTGRQQLNRRDWAGAQEALELALPLLEGKEAADAKVMLGWAIFNNNANPETDRIDRPKKLWTEVTMQHAKTQFHAQAAYYLAVWHKLHGELRHVMANLQQCLDLQPNHIEAAREKRLLEARRSNLAELKELEEREKAAKARRASSSSVPVGKITGSHKPTPAVVKKVGLQKEQSWLEKMFGGGGDDKKKK